MLYLFISPGLITSAFVPSIRCILSSANCASFALSLSDSMQGRKLLQYDNPYPGSPSGGVGGGNVISWSREHGHPAVVHSRGVWGCVPLVTLGVLRYILVHSGTFWGIQRSTQSFLRKRFIIKIVIACWTTEHWKPSPSGRVYTIGLLSLPIPVIVLVCMHKSTHACTMHTHIADWSCDSTHY